MSYRTRIKYTPAQKQEIWDRWEKGEYLNSIDLNGSLPSLNEKKFQEARLLIYPFGQSLNILIVPLQRSVLKSSIMVVMITIEPHKLIFLCGSERIALNDVNWLAIDP